MDGQRHISNIMPDRAANSSAGPSLATYEKSNYSVDGLGCFVGGRNLVFCVAVKTEELRALPPHEKGGLGDTWQPEGWHGARRVLHDWWDEAGEVVLLPDANGHQPEIIAVPSLRTIRNTFALCSDEGIE